MELPHVALLPFSLRFDVLTPFLLCRVWLPQALLEELEGKISTLECDLYAEGASAATVEKILKEKEATEARVAKLYKEVRGDYINADCCG